MDPYRTPTAELATKPAEARYLYSPDQIMVATLLGSPIAGCMLMSANYRGLGREDKALRTRLSGIALTTAVLAFVLFVLRPAFWPIGFGLFPASCVPVRQIAMSLQGDAFARHSELGREWSSNWWVFISVIRALVGITALGYLLTHRIADVLRIH